MGLLPIWGILGVVLLSAQGAPSVLPLLGGGELVATVSAQWCVSYG